MFTGNIKDVGSIQRISKSENGFSLEIKTELVDHINAKVGDSIAVSGICLTITKILDEGGFAVDVMTETLQRTTISQLKVQDQVNLEPALLASDRVDGHFVLGHVDAAIKVVSQHVEPNSVVFTLERPQGLKKFVVEKGSVALDGVSLTVSSVSDKTFSVSLIPFTLQQTTLGQLKINSVVNIETDVLGKYILGDVRSEE